MTFDELDRRLRVFETAHDHCALPGFVPGRAPGWARFRPIGGATIESVEGLQCIGGHVGVSLSQQALLQAYFISGFLHREDGSGILANQFILLHFFHIKENLQC
jgi:hypothetical protein